MIARKEAVKVLYRDGGNEAAADKVPVAVILNGKRPPVVYRLTMLDADELANLFESGDPDRESDLLGKGGHGG